MCKSVLPALLFMLILFRCTNNINGQTLPGTSKYSIHPFEINIFGNDLSISSSIMAVLTNKLVKVIKKGISAGEKDSVVYSQPIDASDTLQEISELDLNELKGYYANNCIDDGSQISVIIKKDGKTKSVFLSNYYLEQVGKMIYLFNSHVPRSYRVWYDKEKLVADYNNCNGN